MAEKYVCEYIHEHKLFEGNRKTSVLFDLFSHEKGITLQGRTQKLNLGGPGTTKCSILVICKKLGKKLFLFGKFLGGLKPYKPPPGYEPALHTKKSYTEGPKKKKA